MGRTHSLSFKSTLLFIYDGLFDRKVLIEEENIYLCTGFSLFIIFFHFVSHVAHVFHCLISCSFLFIF